MKIQKNEKFIAEIEDLRQNKNLNYIDAVIYWCEQNNIEVEAISELIKKDKNITAKIQYDAENLNFIKKTARLPI